MHSSQPKSSGPAAVVGFYDSPEEILEGMKKVRAENYECFDAYTPFPVHGMDQAQGLKRSFLPYVTFTAGLTGTILAFALQYWTSVVDWPLNVGGKPLNSWPAFVPVLFELTVLLGGLCTAAGMILINRLPNLNKKVYDTSITRDRFCIAIERPCVDPEAEDDELAQHARFKAFDANQASESLKRAGAKDVRVVQQQEGWF